MSELRAPSGPFRRIPERLTSHRGAWAALAIGLIVMTALLGMLSRFEAPAGVQAAPTNSESARAAAILEDEFADADVQSVMVVASRSDQGALTAADLAGLDDLLPAIERAAAGEPSGPIVSDDGEAALIVTPIRVAATNGGTAEVVDALRAAIAEHGSGELTLQVTGGPAFSADVAAAFDGADFTLLIVTIAIVALLLILTYRSPVLWLLPLVIVALADRIAGGLAALIGQALELHFDAGIISVLVFGAGTNYALLLISRYREELRRHDDHRAALAAAWRGAAPAIIASNVTVVLALLTLVLAVIPGTRGLGLTSAAGLLVALAAVLLVLPPLLAVCGRRVFWPFVPRPSEADADDARADQAGHASSARQGRAWRAVAAAVVCRPVRALVAGLALLAVMAAGLIGTSSGLDQLERFRVQSESAAGLETLADHFPPGEAQPIRIVVDTEHAEAVTRAAAEVAGVVRAHAVGESVDGSRTELMVTGEHVPGSPESLAQIAALRDAAHAVPGADALVGGAVATDVDARAGNQQDLLLIAPLVLAITVLVLLVLLRSLVAPVVLLLVNAASSIAAIGAGAWLSRVVLGQHALDAQVPLLAFLFLVALGIDYTIFLVHRARTEARTVGTREGMVTAVARTGGVITSAGIVLAGVFAALGVLPLVTLGQLGLIVGVGIVVDTLVVRTVIVPAIFGILGERVWWPSAARRSTLDRDTEGGADEHRAGTAVAG